MGVYIRKISQPSGAAWRPPLVGARSSEGAMESSYLRRKAAAGPQAAPRAGPQAAPRAAPQAAPRAGPQAAPRAAPQAAPFIPHQQTLASANNVRALAQRSGVGDSYAGAGLSSGRGQQAMQQFRADNATAAGNAAANEIMDADADTNMGMSLMHRSMNDSNRLSSARRQQQLQQSDMSNRFNNMTTAWGALAGLVR